MKRGDIYFVDLDPAIGFEQQGRRPVLVLSAEAFNRVTGLPIVAPITNGGGFAKRLGFAVALPPTLLTTGVVRCDQPRVADLNGRNARFVERGPDDVVEDVLERVGSLLVWEEQ